MRYKRRFVTVYKDFPEGCGVPSKPISNADESFMQSKFNKVRRVIIRFVFRLCNVLYAE